MNLQQLYTEMAIYNGVVAYGSECKAWQDFVEDVFKRYGITPWHGANVNISCGSEFENYWLHVADGTSADYDENGS